MGVHWCLVREPSVQGALPEVVRMQRARYDRIRQEAPWQLKQLTKATKEYFANLAHLLDTKGESVLSMGTLACCKGECKGFWKVPRKTIDQGKLIERRANRMCILGTLCKYCHLHLNAKPNRSKKDHDREKALGLKRAQS